MPAPHYFVGDRMKMVFHEEVCPLLYEVPKGETIGFVSRGQAIAEGMTACPQCAPLEEPKTKS